MPSHDACESAAVAVLAAKPIVSTSSTKQNVFRMTPTCPSPFHCPPPGVWPEMSQTRNCRNRRVVKLSATSARIACGCLLTDPARRSCAAGKSQRAGTSRPRGGRRLGAVRRQCERPRPCAAHDWRALRCRAPSSLGPLGAALEWCVRFGALSPGPAPFRPLGAEGRSVLTETVRSLLDHSRQGHDQLRIGADGLSLPSLRNPLERIRLNVEDDLARGRVAEEAQVLLTVRVCRHGEVAVPVDLSHLASDRR